MPANPPDLRALGVEVARLRRARGWSIERLAEAAGISRKAVIQIEAGRVAARITTLHAVAHALAVPIGELVGVVCHEHPDRLHEPAPMD